MRKRVFFLLVLAACTPDFGDRESLVGEPRVLAVVADPPETKPGAAPVTFRVLVASRDGTVSPSPAFAFCSSPKLLTENGPVSAQCLGDAIRPFAGPSIIPQDACTLFGPETPPGGFRPRDPDVTGGYYQPVRIVVGGATSFAFERIQCNLAQAPADAAQAYASGYKPNTNPVLDPMDESPIARGAHVVFRASWPAASAEPYLAFDLPSQSVVTKRESLRVSWFASAGAFDNDVTGRAEDDPTLFTENGFTAPTEGTSFHLWRVLRDSRGGAAWTEHVISIR